MNFQLLRLVLVFCSLPAWLLANAVVPVGMTRDDLLKAHGTPSSTIQVGNREILTYPEGKVTLEKGAVVSSQLTALPKAGGAPEAQSTGVRNATGPTRPKPGWMTDFNAAKALAAKDGRQLLVLFTGSDWCPPCMRFEKDVGHNRRFLEEAQEKHVLVMLDYPHRKPQSAALKHQNETLKQKYQPPHFPSFFLMQSDGSNAVQIELRDAAPGQTPVDAALAKLGVESAGAESSGAAWYKKPQIVGPLALAVLLGLYFIFRQ